MIRRNGRATRIAPQQWALRVRRRRYIGGVVSEIRKSSIPPIRFNPHDPYRRYLVGQHALGGRVMSRREWSFAVSSLVASVSLAGAQTPQCPAFLLDVPANVVTLLTAGQPERRVHILKCERLPDGKILTEVKDVVTGAVFTIADT